MLSLSVSDASPNRAQKLAQAVAEEFVSYVAELETPAGKSTAPVKASIVDRATVPSAPFSPQPTRNITLAAILGLLAGAGLAIVRDSMDTRIRSADDLRTIIDAPVLGNIHFDKSAGRIPLTSGLPRHAPRVESFRVLRTNLQFVSPDAESKVLVVTSAQPGEGKSTTVCNLALSMAEAGQSVVLLEGDLRRPKATLYFGLENTVGVTTILIGRMSLDDAIQEVPEDATSSPAAQLPPIPPSSCKRKA